MRVREAKWADFEDIKNLYCTGYDEIKSDKNFGDTLFLEKPSTKDWIDKFTKRYKNTLDGNATHLVMEEKGKVVGYCVVTKREIPDSELSHVGDLGFRVMYGYRNRGIGTRLIKHTIKSCRGRFDIINAYVISTNVQSKHIFKKMGFRVWGIAPQFVKRGGRYMDLEYLYLKL